MSQRPVWLIRAGTALAGAAVLGALAIFALHRFSSRRAALLSSTPQTAEVRTSFEDFVGSDACAECHRAEYDAWTGSTHARAGGPPVERAVAPFDGTPLRYSDATVTPERTQDGKYLFRVRQKDQPERTFEVAYVVGGGLMNGGGTQAFFAWFPDGTLRFLPFDYSVTARRWLCQTGGRSNRGWAPVGPDISLAECGDWPPRRVLGSHEGLSNCQNCHGSQIRLTFEPDAGRYRTEFTTLAINCESCHGPGRRHIELARAGRAEETTDIGMRDLATLDKNASLEVCFQCHAVKTELRPGYLPGDDLDDYFSLRLPLLSFRPYYPDGRVSRFAYQATHLYSDCYLEGSMTCVDCHDPHTQRYRDIYGRPLKGRFSDGQCVDCHPSKAAAPRRHTHHPAGSPGARCVACHMPYLQEPDVGDQIPYARSDHTIPIPRPGLDAFLRVENACQSCHRDRSLRSLGTQVRDWYGELKPLRPEVEGLLRSRSVQDAATAARLMLTPEDDADFAALQFSGLAYFFLRFLRPDMPALVPEVETRLKEMADARDPGVQALALAGLHLARGHAAEVRHFLTERLQSLEPRPADRVRRRWAAALSFRGDAYVEQGADTSAITAYRRALEILPDDPEILYRLGRAQVTAGATTGAIASFRASLKANPNRPMSYVGLGHALVLRGDVAEGVDAFQKALKLNPNEPSAYVGLGAAYLRSRQVALAIQAYRRALDLDPGMAEANFALGFLYAAEGNRAPAIQALRGGLEFEPGNRRARATLRRLEASPPEH